MTALLLVLAPVLSATAAAPQDRALAVARAQPRVVAHFAALKSEARRVRDSKLRADLLELLDGPRLSIPGAPTPFIAAPAGVKGGHHSYPGGLVDHTLFNLRAGLGLAAAYRKTYGVDVNDDWVRAAAIMHDVGKTLTMRWNADGSLPDAEAQRAGTGFHHIIGIAEALSRGWPAPLVVCVASAHSPPRPGEDLEKLLGFLRAGAELAGKPYSAAGLTDDGTDLASRAPLEAFITHLDDHDFVLTETTIKAADAAWKGKDGWARDEALARASDVSLSYSRGRAP